jgi:hypothetical protein
MTLTARIVLLCVLMPMLAVAQTISTLGVATGCDARDMDN